MTHAEMRRATPARAAASENTYLTTTENSEKPTPNQGEIARRYAADGMPVFPCKPTDKKPLTKHGFQDATTDPSVVEAMWLQHHDAMIGCPTGAASGCWVLDVDIDPDKGIDGKETLAALVATHGPLPPTRIYQTPRGGQHHVFAWPGFPVKCSVGESGLGPGLDVRGDGGYVILPGSRRDDGATYTVERDVAPVAAPQWLLALTATTNKPSNPLPSDGKIAEGGRNSKLTQMGGALRKVGMSAEHILDAIRIINASRCDPPLDDAEVVTIARSVSRYEPAAPIWEGFSETLVCLIPKPPKPGFGIKTRGDITPWVGTIPKPVEFIVGNYIERGAVALLTAEGGAGKGHVALACQVAVAAGRPYLGQQVMQGATVGLYAEDSPEALHNRMYKTCNSLGVDMATIVDKVFTVSLLDDAPGDRTLWLNKQPTARLELLYEELTTIPDLRLLVLDSATLLFGGNEIDRQDVGGFLASLSRMARRLGIGVLLIHHKSKSNDGSSLTMASGSTAWVWQVRAAAELLKATTNDDAKFAVRKVNNAREWETALWWCPEGGLVEKPVYAIPETGKGVDDVFMHCLAELRRISKDVTDSRYGDYAPKVMKTTFPTETKGITLKDLETAMGRLLMADKIKIEVFGPSSRQKKRLVQASHQT